MNKVNTSKTDSFSDDICKNQNITITPHVAAITDADSSIDYIFTKFEQFRKKGKMKSDVIVKNGY